MANDPDHRPTQPPQPSSQRISLDWWAVITALVFALLILTGIISSIPW
jgi:hypothetical protein